MNIRFLYCHNNNLNNKEKNNNITKYTNDTNDKYHKNYFFQVQEQIIKLFQIETFHFFLKLKNLIKKKYFLIYYNYW